MTVFVVGVNHKTASIELRERLAFISTESQAWAAWLIAQGIVREAVILSTCNRTEIYGVCQDATERGAQVRDLRGMAVPAIPATRPPPAVSNAGRCFRPPSLLLERNHRLRRLVDNSRLETGRGCSPNALRSVAAWIDGPGCTVE